MHWFQPSSRRPGLTRCSLLRKASPNAHGVVLTWSYSLAWNKFTMTLCAVGGQPGLVLDAWSPGRVLDQQKGLLGFPLTHYALLVLGLAQALQTQVTPTAKYQRTQSGHCNKDHYNRHHPSGGAMVHYGHFALYKLWKLQITKIIEGNVWPLKISPTWLVFTTLSLAPMKGKNAYVRKLYMA